jgi:copper chaperone CopZ
MTTKTYSVPNISCGHCVMTIEREVKAVAGVKSVKANEQSKAVLIEVESPDVLAQVEALMEEIGYPVENPS